LILLGFLAFKIYENTFFNSVALFIAANIGFSSFEANLLASFSLQVMPDSNEQYDDG